MSASTPSMLIPRYSRGFFIGGLLSHSSVPGAPGEREQTSSKATRHLPLLDVTKGTATRNNNATRSKPASCGAACPAVRVRILGWRAADFCRQAQGHCLTCYRWTQKGAPAMALGRIGNPFGG